MKHFVFIFARFKNKKGDDICIIESFLGTFWVLFIILKVSHYFHHLCEQVECNIITMISITMTVFAVFRPLVLSYLKLLITPKQNSVYKT